MSETEIRKKCIQQFDKLLDNIDVSTKIEESIYNYTIHKTYNQNISPNWNNKILKRIYMNKCMTIYNNLNKDSYVKNDYLLDKILNGDVDPKNIADLTPQQLHPDNWSDLIDKKIAKDEFIYAKKVMNWTDEYKCSKCHERNCSYMELNTRSIDEPSITYMSCLNCGHKWKM